ncbi:MAG: hypothetical protein QNJ55_01685, partial [Xenococcus sp. MO_188.B8]|nr:hypothetical protein [Xenococcus sp. MO_188.B8]
MNDIRAFCGTHVGRDLSIDNFEQKITQHFELELSGHQYNHIKQVIYKFERDRETLKEDFEKRKQASKGYFLRKLDDYNKKLLRDVEDYEKKISQIGSDDTNYAFYIKENSQSKLDSEKLIDLIEELLSKPIFSTALDSNDEAKDSWELSISNLSLNTREKIRELKSDYDTKQENLDNQFGQEKEKLERDTSVKIYKYIFLQKINQNGYPLNSKSRQELNLLLQELNNLDQKIVKIFEKESIKPLYQDNLEKYEQEYKERLKQEGYPLELSSITELENLRKSLGLEDLIFPDLDAATV